MYLVRDPATFATLDGANLDTTLSHDDITATGIAAGGTITIRENWFPRWRASVDGMEVPVVHRADGYMDVTVPVGSEQLVVTYSETGLDWIARLIAFASALSWMVLLYWSRRDWQPGGRLRIDEVVRPGWLILPDGDRLRVGGHPELSALGDVDLAGLPLVDDDQSVGLEDADDHVGEAGEPFEAANQHIAESGKRGVPAVNDLGQCFGDVWVERRCEDLVAVWVGPHAGMVPPSGGEAILGG
jgi:hypothetical protein